MQPDWQPTLTGRQVVLRPTGADDWAGMFSAAADPEIWAGHPAQNRYEEPVFRAFFDSALASHAALTILNKQTGEIIGSSRYDGYDPKLSEVEIGWTFLARSAWGGAYNGEIKRLMLDHAFRFVDTVVFWIGETNQRSRRAMEKIGGVPRPDKRDRASGDRIATHVIYEMRKSPVTG